MKNTEPRPVVDKLVPSPFFLLREKLDAAWNRLHPEGESPGEWDKNAHNAFIAAYDAVMKAQQAADAANAAYLMACYACDDAVKSAARRDPAGENSVACAIATVAKIAEEDGTMYVFGKAQP